MWLHGQRIAMNAQPRDHAGAHGRQDRLIPPVGFANARVNIADVHLDDGAFADLDRIEHSNGVIAECGGIDRDAGGRSALRVASRSFRARRWSGGTRARGRNRSATSRQRDSTSASVCRP